jgi:hypothetical protein
MRLAERGFQIRRMPSKAEWVQEAKEAGLHLVRSRDLTSEALPFWTTGWRAARSVLRLVPGVRALGVGADSLLAVTMTAHALREADRLAGSDGAIAVAPIPETGLGRAINDRLRRAAAPRE